MVRRDGFDWERVAFGEPFLPLGPAGSFDHRQIRLASSLVVRDDRILLFGDERILLTQPLRFDAGTRRVNATVQPGGYGKAE